MNIWLANNSIVTAKLIINLSLLYEREMWRNQLKQTTNSLLIFLFVYMGKKIPLQGTVTTIFNQ